MGQTFTVVSDDTEEHVRQIAELVDRQIREQASKTHVPFAAAVMAALNIASEYHKLRSEHGCVQDTIDRLVERLGQQESSAKAERR